MSLSTVLTRELRTPGCEVLRGVPLGATSASYYLLPDLVVVCGKPVTSGARGDAITNPKVIFEIKFELYCNLGSFTTASTQRFR